MAKKVIKVILIIALIALVAIQFIRPEKNSSGYESVAAFEAETKPSAEVAAILKNQCYDCHSNETKYPWYAEIAPASYWLSDHIKDGKKHFSASAWQDYSIKKKDHKMEEMAEMVENGEMPLESYALIHGNLTDENKELLLQWVGLVRLQFQSKLQVTAK